MIKEFVDSLKDNPVIAAGLAIGAGIGIGGGVFLGSNGFIATLLAGGLGLVGAAAGLFAGSYASKKLEESQPAKPLGMRQVDAKQLEPGKVASVGFRPSAKIAEKVVEEVQRSMPEVAHLLPSNLAMLAPLSKVNMDGGVQADGRSMHIDRIQLEIPGVSIPPAVLSNIDLVLKDGAIDQSNPQNIETFKQIGRQMIGSQVAAPQQERAYKILDQALADPAGVSAVASALQRAVPHGR